MGVINSIKSGVRRVKNFVSPPVEISEEAVEEGAKLSLGELRKSRKDLRNAYKSWRKGEIDSEAYLEAREKNDFYRLSREKDWKNHEINTKTLSGEEFISQQSKAMRAEANDTKYFKNNPSDVSKVTAEEAKREAAEASVKTKPSKSVQEAIDKENAEKIAAKDQEYDDSFLVRSGFKPNSYQKRNASNIDAAFSSKAGEHFNAAVKDIEGAEDFGRIDKQKISRITNDRKNLETDLRGAKDQEAFNKILKDRDISTEGDLGENISNYYKDQLNANATIGDVFHAYHGPAIVGAGIVGASVLKMSDNRGRVPNSQLYSDPF